MGTEQPEWGKTSTETKISFLPFFIGAVLLLVALAVFQKICFNGETEAPKLSPKEEAKLQKRLKEIDDSEQYALVAITDGFYQCLHSGRISCYLKTGEVWKYGVTSKGKFGRYATNFLLKNKVSYFVEFRGTISECLKMEQVKLYTYPYLPENLARPPEDRLPRPPFNSKMQ